MKWFKIPKRIERTLHGDINPKEIDKILESLGIKGYNGKDIEEMGVFLAIKIKEKD